MKSFALGTAATVTVVGPAIVTGLMNSGGDVPGSMIVAVNTVCGGGGGVGVGVGVKVGVGLGVVVGVGVGGVGVGVTLGVAVGVGVGVGEGVGVVKLTITSPRGELLPSCVKLRIRRKCLSGTTIVRVPLVMMALLYSPARQTAVQRQLVKNAADCLLILVFCYQPNPPSDIA